MVNLNYDKKFNPISLVYNEFKKNVAKSKNKLIKICVERNNGYNYIYTLSIFDDEKENEENYKIVSRIIKAILWVVGGYKIYVSGDEYIYNRIKQDYTREGSRAFDVDFMERVYEKPFEVVFPKVFPESKTATLPIGGHLNGNRIGFDAGGSDRKVSAVVNGKVVYSEEVVWSPKINTDWHYHYDGILTAMKTAASKMDSVDAIGVSSAGVYIDNKIMVASLFLKVPKEDYKPHVQNMYMDVAKEIGAPIEVANDGDVTALAGAMDLNDNCVLGIAMGTSEAVGYINDKGNLNGWISELAFVPVDFNEDSMVDEWSGDYGCGVKYLSQDGVIKLAEYGGYKFNEKLSPAEKLKEIQELAKKGDSFALKIYEDIGVYMGYAIAFYSEFYKIKHLLVLGRVTSGEGGSIICKKAKEVLEKEFPSLKDINISMPDEKNKRVGQSIAAASLKKI
ncbi:MAG: ROK family protein [Firmicutes bacterium]|nr:ROK family protein [Candidatus Caballimonas caccae]